MNKTDSVALVTGASSGIGAAFCRQLAPRCDAIIAVARRRDRLEALARELAPQVTVHPVVADLTTIEGMAHTLDMLRQKGPVDLLVNNAGFSPFGGFEQVPIDRQRDMLSLHLDATVTLCHAAVPFMRERGGGAIINVSSILSMMPVAGLSVYSATKAFLNQFSQSLALELAADHIEVQALLPGLVRTEMHDLLAQEGYDPSAYPEELWMTADEVVAESLAALGSGQSLVVAGAGNRAAVRDGVQALLATLAD